MEEERRLWSIRVDEASDREDLLALDRHLSASAAPWAGALRFKVGRKLAMLRAAARSCSGHAAFAAAYGLPAPDGRWLYCYRLEDAAFQRLQQDLSRRRLDELETGHMPGLFVLWASEWFRRCYRGGGHRWEDLAHALGIPVDQPRLRSLTARGLRIWGREVIGTGVGREYLSSLAREGGFPTAAVDEGGRGWARDVLTAIVAPLLAEPAAGAERAKELAAAQRHRLPQLFRDDEFLALCADLALAIVALRRDADGPAASAGIPVVAWLELNRPGWRETLPLTTAERAADALVEQLMQVEAIAGGAVGVERLLVRMDEGWREAVRINLDGVIDSAAMRAIDAREGRLRAFAAGEMARALPGELAMIEPPASGETSWTCRATKRGKGIQLAPFAAAIELDLRSGEHRAARISLPGGKPRRGQLLVAELDAGAEDAPEALRLIGSGSGLYRAPTVYLQAPLAWRVDATAEEAVEQIGPGVAGALLWKITGGAFVTDLSGDRYRIRTSQAGDAPARIELIGDRPPWATVAEDVDLFVGAPVVHTSRPGQGAVHLREIGTRGWRPAPRTLPVGHYELAWRQDGILLDRRRLAVLPQGAAVSRTGMGRDTRYHLHGFEGVTIRPCTDAPVVASQDGACWTSRPVSNPVHRFDAEISWPGAPSLTVSIEYPCAAAIARWDGRVLPDRTRVTLADLPELVAVDRGRMELFGALVDPQTRQSAEMSWEFDRELPMSSVAADIASLLLPASIDAEVKLGMHDGIETYWYVRQFAVQLERAGTGLVASKGVVAPNAELCGRALAAPATEVSFGDYSLLTDANHRPVPLPDDIAGPWLVYLRAGDAVLSRPLLVFGGASAGPPSTDLTRAMALSPRDGLDNALWSVLDQAGGEGQAAGEIIAELVALTTSLRGLPPATFRVLELAARRPAVLARTAMAASPEQRDAVLALSDALPFAWCALPKSFWDVAQRIAFEDGMKLLAATGNDLGSGPRHRRRDAEAPPLQRDSHRGLIRRRVGGRGTAPRRA